MSVEVWREAGRWWEFEPYREITRTSVPRREVVREMPSLGLLPPAAAPPGESDPEDQTEDWSLRERKIRDEKIGAAVGSLPASYYERVGETPHGSLPAPRADEVALLHVLSGYSFGRSTLLPDEVALFAARGGCGAVALRDRWSLAGAAEFVQACRRHDLRPLVGASVQLAEGGWLGLVARSKRGYRSLSRLLTACHLGEARGAPVATWKRLATHAEDLLCFSGGNDGPLDPLLARRDMRAAEALVERLIDLYGSPWVLLEVERSWLPWQRRVEAGHDGLAARYRLRAVASTPVTHARPAHFPAQDVLVCIDTLATIEDVHGRREPRPRSPERALNAERYLLTAAELRQRYADRPDLLRAAAEIAQCLDPEVLPPRTRLPALYPNDDHALAEIVGLNAPAVYRRVTPMIQRRLSVEVERIQRLGFASHFLLAYDMVRWAGEHGIQFSGRGSVVDSAVAYVLGIARIDAIEHRLHFDRFLPDDGNKRPDIDIDFEARRRDEVRAYLTRRYGQDRVATVAAYGALGTRGIIREVGKVFGLPEATLGFLAKKIHGGIPADQIEAALDKRPELRDHAIPREHFRWVLRLAERLMDVPRNLRAHSSGIVISDGPIADTVPVQWGASPAAAEGDSNLRLIQWDKRSSKHFFDKFDVLCLRGQDVLSRVEEQARRSDLGFDVRRVALDNPETYRAFRSGELIGVPQSASPAMRQAHVRLRTESLADASLVQAGIRPGVGGAVKINELIARRRGVQHYSFEHPELERILGNTYGIVVFQEQIDQLLQAFCGCSSGEAEDIRDSIHKRRREDYGQMIREEILARIRRQGFGEALAQQVFEYVAGFKGYGFAQGHALAFAEISVRCVHLMQSSPAEYFAALLSSQPAGYYGPCTLVNEARARGVRILPPCVLHSQTEFTTETARDAASGLRVPGGAIRVGLMQVSGLSITTRERILAYQAARAAPVPQPERLPLPHVRRGPVALASPPPPAAPTPPELTNFLREVLPEQDELESLILCGALDTFCPHRRALLWATPGILKALRGDVRHPTQPTLPEVLPPPDLPLHLADFNDEERAAYERSLMDLDIAYHLMAFERARIGAKALTCDQVRHLPPGQAAVVVGNPIRLRFPPTASGKRVVFFDLEDESGLLNVTCFDAVYQRDGRAIVTAPYVTLRGVTQDRDGHTAFLAHRVFEYRPVLLRERAEDLPVTRGDFIMGGTNRPKLK